MTSNIPISARRYSWLALLGCTLGIQLVIMVVMGVVALFLGCAGAMGYERRDLR